ncbi:hypothetical protein GLOTRDRAFT_127924 [Gloeophyllum trabeum ATCC 11539]|uniref:Integrase core domain-containing protein n=1 Tax=Gloeophyllum trabeum (strain ATCC 11539 / FP-39264 / Madison 617) TaxID=670483 RepID=S7QCG7_GLOTA|nr:uncharacterized protein GLOTRDRAFT_127924 [Gloeophyllum trabeum ATCC 11539]EPQ57571.1 hypothetical protein GLOTRDRAFT_127924 [Gloeophyllum trabeum ATCC 11539]
MRLERLHQLDHSDPTHLWLLHILFLDSIRDDCRAFQEEWNHHPISGEGHDQTPLDMRFLGQLEHGVYDDGYEDVHPDVLNRYYGADSTHERLHPGQTGAGHSDSEDEGEALEDLIAADQERHVRHDPIPVPKTSSPFPADLTADFLKALDELLATDIVPTGLGLRNDEWPEGGYPEAEAIRSGRKYVDIGLPFNTWWPRAVVWGKALTLLSHFQAIYEEAAGISGSDSGSSE